jgi:hypothetical protein
MRNEMSKGQITEYAVLLIQGAFTETVASLLRVSQEQAPLTNSNLTTLR